MDWTYPVYEIELDGRRIDPAVVGFEVWTHSDSAADSAGIVLSDPESVLHVSRGQKVVIRWGYRDDAQLVTLFEGLVREASPSGLQIYLQLIDYQAVLQAEGRRVRRSWEQATAAEIAGDLLAGTGLSLAATVPETAIDRFPVHGRTPREALQQLVALLRTETGEEIRTYVRGGKLVLAPDALEGPSVLSLETGVNLVGRRPGQLGMERVETLVAPVLHSQVIEVDGERLYVKEATYRWEDGGRTVLQVVPCAMS